MRKWVPRWSLGGSVCLRKFGCCLWKCGSVHVVWLCVQCGLGVRICSVSVVPCLKESGCCLGVCLYVCVTLHLWVWGGQHVSECPSVCLSTNQA